MHNGTGKTPGYTGEVRTNTVKTVSRCCGTTISSVGALFLRVKKEVDDVIGMKHDITYDDLGKLVYLGQVHVMTSGKL